MPFDRSKYPADWETRVARIRARAGNRCEWLGCDVPNGALIIRDPRNLERYRVVDEATAEVASCVDGEKVIRVVLTVAHLDEGGPLDCPDDRLAALCQLHHLRLDAKLHGRNAAETRRRKQMDAGQASLFEVTA